jgi:hypothetical protein
MVAATASAEPLTNPNDRSLAPIFTSVTAEPIGSPGTPRIADYPLYSNMTMTATLYYVTGSNGPVSADDYNKIIGDDGSIYIMDHFQFIGGVVTAGQVLFFTFWQSSGLYPPISSFGVQLPYAGAYIWTITGAGGGSMNRQVGHCGIVQMWADNGIVVTPSTGIWYLNSDPPTVGTTGPTYPGFTDGSGHWLNHKFAILVPEPGTVALFGMGVLTLLVRRRH